MLSGTEGPHRLAWKSSTLFDYHLRPCTFHNITFTIGDMVQGLQTPPLPLFNFFYVCTPIKKKKNSLGIPTFTVSVFFPLTLYHYCQTHLIQTCATINIHLLFYLFIYFICTQHQIKPVIWPGPSGPPGEREDLLGLLYSYLHH